MGLYFTAAGLRSILTNEGAVGPNAGILSALKAHLFTNNPALTPGLKWSDLVEATFDGYAAKGVLTWQAPFSDAGGITQLVGAAPLNWADAGSVTPNSVTGYALTTGDPTPVLLAVEIFPAPRQMAGVGDAVVLIPNIALACDQTALPGAGLIV